MKRDNQVEFINQASNFGERQNRKNLMFPFLYSSLSSSIGKALGLSQEEAEDLLRKYE